MKRLIATTIGIALLTLAFAGLPTHAASIPSSDFSLEVSPSPLVAEVKPGEAKTIDLKVRNAGTKPEQLKIQARGFSIAHPSEQINITPNTPPDLAEWVTFLHPTFTVDPGQWFTQKITIALPDSAGFSYPFVVVISREEDPTPTAGGASLRGSIAVFTLVNVNKPGATRTVELVSVKADRGFYEYLPTTFEITLKNTGNSIVQPYGNLYVQTPGMESTPHAVIPVNDARGYILPGDTKTMTATWSDGFPFYETTAPRADGKQERKLQWNWDNVSHFRAGQYSAKVVAVYNDGTRDVPITGEVSFWVIPWRILLGALVVVLVFGFGIWSILKRIIDRLSKPKTPHTS